mgnify:CR=1 FL=1
MLFPKLSAPLEGGHVFPLFQEGTYWLFWLNQSSLMRWSSRDLLDWEEHAPAPLPALVDEDRGTCCAVAQHEGLWWLFVSRQGEILSFYSEDLIVWQEDQDQPVISATGHPYRGKLSDPFVFYDVQAAMYRMIFGARSGTGPKGRSGCVGTAVSRDLRHWQLEEPIYGPNLASGYRGTSLIQSSFKRWHLLFHKDYFEGERPETLTYRAGNQCKGPFRRLPSSQLYGGDIVGTPCAIKVKDKLHSFPILTQAGVSRLATPREWKVQLDGSITETLAQPVFDACRKGKGFNPLSTAKPLLGLWKRQTPEIFHCQDDELGRLALPESTGSFLMEGELLLEKGIEELLILVGADPQMQKGVQVSLSARLEEITVRSSAGLDYHRNWPIPNGKIIRFKLLVANDGMEIFLDDQVSLSALVPGLSGGSIFLECRDGRGKIGNVTQYPLT